MCYRRCRAIISRGILFPQFLFLSFYFYHGIKSCGNGACYNLGTGVTKDYTQAVYWFRKAAEQGHAEAQFQLGLCYSDGNGVERDKNTALYWYEKAVKNEDKSLKESSKTLVESVIKHNKEQGYSSSRAKP